MSDVKIKKSALSYPVMFEKTSEEYAVEDKRFIKVKVWLMHLGQNFNGSVFEKEVVDEAIPTLGYIPIVGFIKADSLGEKDFSDHHYILSKNENGVYKKYVGSAYGVVMSSADNNAHYEQRVCDDGVERTFLVVDGLMWRMFEDSSSIMDRDIIKNHSMELQDKDLEDYDGYEDEDGIFHFTRFSFRAACILGESYEPAMMNSTVEVQFTMTDFVKEMQNELCENLNLFTKMVNEKSNQGGIGIMPATDFGQTVMELFSDISNLVSQQEVMESAWGCGTCPRFYLQDIQDDEVIVVDRKNNYCHYGFPFTINGDKPEIDFTNGNRKKIQYVNYEEGTEVPEGSFDFGKHIAEIEQLAFEKVDEVNAKLSTAEEEKVTAETNYATIQGELEGVRNELETAQTNYATVKADFEEMKPKYDAYVKAEEEKAEIELNARKDAIISDYALDLGNNEEFAAIKANKAEMSVEEIENKCALLYVKENRVHKTNFSRQNNSGVLGIMDENIDNGDMFVQTKYGNIRKSK